MRHILLFFSVWILSLETYSAQTDNMFVVCERQSDVRYLRVFSSNDGKCKTVYAKDGFTQVVGSATFFSSCESVLVNVRKNIEGGGFKCREAQLVNFIEIN